MKDNIFETLVGFIVLVIAGFILFYAYMGSKKDNLQGYPLMVRFEKADGLMEGSDVKVSGIKVGCVASLKIDHDSYQAVATITINPGLQFPKDTSAAIVSESLLGGKYLSLNPGGDEEYLKPGDEIVHAQSSIILESLIGQMVFNNKDDNNKEGEKEKDDEAA
jgi:phospholipid/cholesterol/gamma-HCH transport system substrate-binding protein